MEDVTITVNIADRPYRLKIKGEEEEDIRKAVGEIEMKLKSYSEQFSFKDKQDMLAMALLHFSATAVTLENNQQNRESPVLHKLKELDQLLSEHLV
jgi:cell division protein ZapA